MKFKIFVTFFIFTFLCLIQENNGLKILALFMTHSKSHHILGQAMLKNLAKHGHEVTMVSPNPLKKPIPNYRDIVLGDLHKKISEHVQKETGKDMNMFDMHQGDPLSVLLEVYDFGHLLANLCIEDPAVQKLIKSGEKFDIVINEIFMNDVFFAFADHFNAHAVGFSTVGASEWCNDYVGNPQPYSYVPEIFLGFTDRMTFLERLINTVMTFSNELINNYIHFPKMEAIRKKHLPNTRPLSQIITNVSLVILNSHPSLSNPRPLVPNMIEVGGFHVDPPGPLPANLKKTLDEAKHGVVYFSMGSNLQSAQLPPKLRDTFLKVFGRLKQTVLWKWEENNLPGQPKNVIISQWFPQQDLLAHPNVKLFITHGGLLSTIEAVSRGVPVIGIPVFADQKLNMGNAAALGYGQSIDFANLTEESLTWALNEVLSNPKYTKTVKYRSAVLNDRALHPQDELNYWLEYIVRHKGAPHLRTARNDLKLYQYLLLDIVGFVALVVLAIILTIYFSIKVILRKLCSKSGTKKADTKKKTN